MLIACVSISHFMVELERSLRPELHGRPVIIGGAPEDRQVVWDCSREAEDYGVQPAMALRSALSHCRDAIFLEPRPNLYEESFEKILRHLEKVGPFVEPGSNDGRGPAGFAFVNLSGVPGHQEIPARLAEAIPAGFPAGIGLAPNKFTARLAALQAANPSVGADDSPEQGPVGAGQALAETSDLDPAIDPPGDLHQRSINANKSNNQQPDPNLRDDKQPLSPLWAEHSTNARVLVIPEDQTREFLAHLPTSLLTVSQQMHRRLGLFGIGTLGELARLVPGSVQAQFGREGLRAWRLARGEDNEPVRGRRRETTVIRRLTFPSPTASIDSLLIALRQLITRAFAAPALYNRGARRVHLRTQLSGSRSWERTLTLREPSADSGQVFFALKSLIGNLVLPGPVEEVAVQISGLCGETGKQQSMFAGNSGRDRQLQDSIRQLKARFGCTPIYRLVEVEPWSRIPERRRALIDFDP
jgi:nucleotidyltransferase/DNA polymerase involved in DNA repair